MLVAPDGHKYPAQRIRVCPFEGQLDSLFKPPRGQVGAYWPPRQMTYIGLYLGSLHCKTIVHERHYIDRHYIDDFSLFYSRSLRDYPNSCQRLHFFASEFDEKQWSDLIRRANDGSRREVERELAEQYLGFMVVKPLAGSPVGRTVLRTFGRTTSRGHREFPAIRRYPVTLAGLSLEVEGLAFQQQDQGVSACATTALWSALQRTAPLESLSSPTPAQITEAASRYMLPGGRALPSEGLRFDQLCEAVRATGLAPVSVTSISPREDQAHIATYLRSGLPVLLGIVPFDSREGHAVCLVGLRFGSVEPPTDSSILYRDGATAVNRIYVHDDRLGPYASARLKPLTVDGGNVVTTIELRWPDETPDEESLLLGMLIPAPVKLRLSAVRLRVLGHEIAQAVAAAVPTFAGLEVHTLFCRGAAYQAQAHGFDLSLEGLRELTHETVLSRYVGVVRLITGSGPVADVLVDATETSPNPAVLAIVRREGASVAHGRRLRVVARVLGANGIT